MLLNPVSDSSITGTGTLDFQSGILGGVLITADGTNDTTVILQRDDVDGFTVFKIVTKSPIFIAGPFNIGSNIGYYSVTGTGHGAQFYEWVE